MRHKQFETPELDDLNEDVSVKCVTLPATAHLL